jgi:MFS family permease
MSFTSARRDLSLVVTAKSVSWLGDEVAMIALTLLLQASGRGAAAIAELLIANALPMVLLSGVVGRVVDRFDNRALLIGSSLAQAALCTVLAFVSAPAVVLVLVALLGAGQSVNSATWTALLPAIVGPEHVAKAIGRSQVGTTLAGIVAPALGGVLTGLYGSRVPLLVDAATFLGVLAAAVLMHTRREISRPARGVKQHGGLAIVRKDGLLRPLFVLLALFVLIGSMVNVADVFLVRATLGASTTWYGIVGAAFAAGALTGAVLSSRLAGTRSLALGFVGAAITLAVGLCAIGLAPAVAWLLPFGFVTGAGNGVLNVTLSSLVIRRTRAAERGRVGALLNGTASGTQLLAYAAGGVLLSVLDARLVFVLAGSVALLAPALFGRRVVRAAADEDQAESADMTPTALAA